jgi:hypothetical protein
VDNFIKLFSAEFTLRITLSFGSGYASRGVNYAEKNFSKLTPGANVVKLFTAVSYDFS